MAYKNLSYGMSNFADLVESNYAYVDKTRFIELLEKESCRYQFFVRPRRFGKSLFLSLMENYYDLNRKDKFETLFGNFYIGKHPTSEQGKYAILKFNFSGIDIRTHDSFRDSFSDNVQETVKLFLKKYKNLFPEYANLLDSPDKKVGIGAMNLFYTATISTNTPVFVIIDEYDSFANNLIAIGEAYGSEMKKEGGLVRAF